MTDLLLADAAADADFVEVRADVIYFIFLVLFIVPFMIWLIRRLRVTQQNIKRSLEQNDELIKLLSRSCEHSEATERHMAAVENKLDQMIEQLKRRPLS